MNQGIFTPPLTTGLVCKYFSMLRGLVIACCLSLGLPALASAEIYKYQDEHGRWHFSDKPKFERNSKHTQAIINHQEQHQTKDFYITKHAVKGKTWLYAQNNKYAPVEVELNFTQFENCKTDNDAPSYVVKPRSNQVLVLIESDSPYESQAACKFALEYHYVMGDPDAEPDETFYYQLPFAKFSTHRVTQDFHGNHSHYHSYTSYAIDFEMPINTRIYAAREGTVVKTVDKWPNAEITQGNMAETNYIRILHQDGTFSEYAHLDQHSIVVKVGDHIEQGQYIAESGNSGQSTGPHLHFAILKNVGMKVESIEFYFEDRQGEPFIPSEDTLLTAF